MYELKPGDCMACAGCGKIASGEEGAPWKYWENLPPGSDLAVRMGTVTPIECPECHGSGKWQHDLAAQAEREGLDAVSGE